MSHQAVADSEQALTYPADAGADTFLLAVRGTPVSASLEEARKIHNATAGAPQSIAGARSLGDLSHNVYTPYGESASPELLFIDFWNSLSGLGEFFQNKMVQEAASQLFASRDGVVWARAEGVRRLPPHGSLGAGAAGRRDHPRARHLARGCGEGVPGLLGRDHQRVATARHRLA